METQIFKVRDIRNKNWFFTDNLFLDDYAKHFGAIGASVYFALCRRADEHQKSYPSQKNIAEMLSISDRTVRNCLKRLEMARFFRIERKYRDGGGKWRHNVYFLLDKSEWMTPEEIVSSGNQRNIKSKPKERGDTNHRNELPTNNTNEKNINRNNTHTAKPRFAIIDDLINKFSDVNPSYKKLRQNLTQRKATERLMQELGVDRVSEIIGELSKAIKEKYCPVITTPLELERKVSQLLVYLEKRKKTRTDRFVDQF